MINQNFVVEIFNIEDIKKREQKRASFNIIIITIVVSMVEISQEYHRPCKRGTWSYMSVRIKYAKKLIWSGVSSTKAYSLEQKRNEISRKTLKWGANLF